MCNLSEGIEERGEKRGIKIGEAKAEEKINRLNQLLIEQNRMEDLIRSTSDKEFQKGINKGIWIVILSERYRIPMTYDLRKEMQTMCNLSEGIEERGEKRGIRIGEERGMNFGDSKRLVKSVDLAMENFHINLEKACEGLGTTVEEYREAKKMISGK